MLLDFIYNLKVQENLNRYYYQNSTYNNKHLPTKKVADTPAHMFFLAMTLPFIVSAIIYTFVATLSNIFN